MKAFRDQPPLAVAWCLAVSSRLHSVEVGFRNMPYSQSKHHVVPSIQRLNFMQGLEIE